MEAIQTKFSLLVCIGVCIQIHTAVSQRGYLDLYEGDSCSSKNGMAGICSRAQKCTTLNFNRGRQRNPNQYPEICSFIGSGSRSEPIVCCPITHAATTDLGPGPRPVKPTSKQEIKPTPKPGVAKPVVAKPAVAKPAVVNPVPSLGTRLEFGAKSKIACQKYIKDSQSEIHLLISGGEEAEAMEFPHMALLGYNLRGGGPIAWRCGGALISDRYVVSAAHCLKTREGNVVRVRLGENDITDEDDNSVDYGVEKLIVHPQFKSSSWYNDLGLIRLNMQVRNTRYIRPACLYTKPEEPLTGLIVTGWGVTPERDDASSDTLLKGLSTLSFVPAQQCNEHYPVSQLGAKMNRGIQSGQFCATDPAGNVDTCEGDSGGPIQIRVDSKRETTYYIVGITSGGSKGCGGGIPSVYTRIYHYLEWIEGHVWP